MALQSRLLSKDPRLEAAAVSDSAHVMQGASGPFVRKIQQALNIIGPSTIDVEGQFGPDTAAAVLLFKKTRNIVNSAYQRQPDAIVGKLTIAALDDEVFDGETPDEPARCVLDCTCSPIGLVGRRRVSAITSPGVRALSGDDDTVAQLALAESRRTLNIAIRKIGSLQQAMTRHRLPFGPRIPDADNKTLGSCNTWLNTDGDTLKTLVVLASTVSLMRRNISVRTSKGKAIEMRRVPDGFHACVDGNPDNGIQLGEPFFTVDGPLCRRDVITHEFFHFLGVAHGGGALNGPTIRDKIVTTAQALDSADNLAQLVSELATPDGSTDSCAIAHK